MMEIPKQAVILASDIDNTLTGDETALQKLNTHLTQLQKVGKLCLYLSTGRSLPEVLAGFEEEHIPVPQAIITQVGTEIYLPPFTVDMPPLPDWDNLLKKTYQRAEALAFLADIQGITLQADHYNTPLKVSCFLENAPDSEAVIEQLKTQLQGSPYQIIWSSSQHLDILPAASGKGKAIRFLIEYLQKTPQQVIVAGDSGNDTTMFAEFRCGIVVANAQPELKAYTESESGNFYFASQPFAAGVTEGLTYFGLDKVTG